MPELPEVETIVRDLRRLVTGAEIRSAEVLKKDLIVGNAANFEASLRGRRLREITRRAKNILIRLDDARDLLVINLGMTGRVLVTTGTDAEPPHLGARFELIDGRRILYQDVRRFGRLELVSAEGWEKREAGLGLEPLSPEFTATVLHQLTRDSRVAIKTWLMDQHRVVGVGNIYASEALFRAGIHPARRASTLGGNDAVRLRDALLGVLEEAIEARGTTFSDYVDAGGETGGFAVQLRVYDREGEPCVRCGTPVERTVITNRSAFFCPECQPKRRGRR